MQTKTNIKYKDNKGFTIHNGEEYIGFLILNEKQVSPEFVKSLQNPEVMKAIIAQAELRVFAPKEDKVLSSTQAIIDSVLNTTNETSAPSDELLSSEDLDTDLKTALENEAVNQ